MTTVQFKLTVTSNNPDQPQTEAWDIADQLIIDLQYAIDNYTDDDFLELSHLPAHFRRNPDEYTHGELLINTLDLPYDLPNPLFILGEMAHNISDGDYLQVIGLQYFAPTKTWVYTMQSINNGLVLGEFTDNALISLNSWSLLNSRANSWGYTWDDGINRFRKKGISISIKDVIFCASREDKGEKIPF